MEMISTEARKSCILITVAVIVSFFASLNAFSQTAAPPRSTRATKNRRVNLYYHLGSIEVPAGFRGEVTANWTDAWGGFLESSDGSFKVLWRAGTIEYVLEKRRKDIVWHRTEKIGNQTFDTALLQDKVGGNTFVAKIGWLEFSSKVESKEQEELLRGILGTYKKERCKECRSLPIKTEN